MDEGEIHTRTAALWGKSSIRDLTRREAEELIGDLLLKSVGGEPDLHAVEGAREAPTRAQIAFLKALCGRLNWDEARLMRLANRMYGVGRFKDLGVRQASGLIEALKAIQRRRAA
jgi:hypothetical protein